MTSPTATRNQRKSNDVGERTELGRYRTAAGVERVLYGQRVAKVVRFLPGEQVVLVRCRSLSDDCISRARGCLGSGVRAHAVRHKRHVGERRRWIAGGGREERS